MKHFLVYFLISILFFSCNKEYRNLPEMPNAGEINVLTYNVAGLPEGINTDQHPIKHTPLISPLLNNYNIVNVQEDFAYHNILYSATTHPYKSIYEAKTVFGDGLNTLSVIPFLYYTRIKWNNCNGTDCLTPKGFTFSRLFFKKNIFVDLYNVHCNAGSDANDMAARRKNILQLAAFIEKHSANNATIIMGDFNCRYTRTGDNIREIINKGFKDAWVELIRNNNFPLFNDISLMDCTTNATNENCEVVDKIFYRSSTKISLTATFYKLDGNEFYDNENEPLSDHRPLQAKFKYVIN